jgi:hypothetical protein
MSKRRETANKMWLLCVAASLAGQASQATAQWDTMTDPEGAPAVVAPQPPPAPGTVNQAGSTGLVTEPPATTPKKKKGPRIQPQWGIDIGVPLWLDVDRDVVRPGAQLDFWAAADFGYVTLGGRLGFGWTPVELSKTSEPQLQWYGREPLRRVNFSPEVRLQIPGEKVLPYLSNAFDMNWWNFLESNVYCDPWYWSCSSFGVYRFSPGYTGRVGIGIRAAKAFHIDLGFAWSLTGKGDFFHQKFWALSPYVGFLFRR